MNGSHRTLRLIKKERICDLWFRPPFGAVEGRYYIQWTAISNRKSMTFRPTPISKYWMATFNIGPTIQCLYRITPLFILQEKLRLSFKNNGFE